MNTQRFEMPNALSRYRAIIDRGLRDVLDDNSNFSYVMMRYYMGWSDVYGNAVTAETGKYLRPSLCLLSAESTGTDPIKALPTAVSLELIHNFSLIHDDIQDQDEIRHHRKTLWAEWGIPKALVTGDLMYTLANLSLLDTGLINNDNVISPNLLNEACLEMIEGQYLDLHYEGKFDLTIDDYLGMVSRKTGALLRCSVDSGVVLGDSSEDQRRHLSKAASALGYAFQIRDDILGTWGDQNSTGKPVGADIRRKKNALPIVHLMNHIEQDSRQKIITLMQGDNLEDSDVQLILRHMSSVGSYEFCQNLAEQFCSTARDEIIFSEVPRIFMNDFEELIEFVAMRVH